MTNNGKVMDYELAARAILPQVEWQEGEYADLLMRLDLYTDMIVATRYERSFGGLAGHQVQTSSFIVDPLDLAERLANLDLDSGLLPADCLFWQRRGGQHRLGLWLPPRVWHLRAEHPSGHSHGSPTDRPNRTIPLPGLVFVGQGQSFNLWALATPERPTLDTPLYRAPTPNVSARGVCRGNVEFPDITPATAGRAFEAFIESGFSNHLDDGKSKRYPKGILKMWQVLHRAKAETYPVGDLVEAGVTLGEVVGSRE